MKTKKVGPELRSSLVKACYADHWPNVEGRIYLFYF